jgi:hypothetical protein
MLLLHLYHKFFNHKLNKIIIIMNININLDDIDKINSTKLRELPATTESTIQLLRHLKLLPTKVNDNESCPKDCNDWYTGKNQREIDGMFI